MAPMSTPNAVNPVRRAERVALRNTARPINPASRITFIE